MGWLLRQTGCQQLLSLSMAGLIAFLGKDGSVYLMGWTGGYVLLALLLAPYLRKFGKFTVPDFIGERYYSSTARKLAVLCLIFISFTYIAGQMRGVGIVFSRFLEVDINTGVIVGMAIVFFYAVLGWHEGHHLHSGSAVLCSDFCISRSSNIYFDTNDGRGHTSDWIW